MFSGKGGAQGRSDAGACFQALIVVQPGELTDGILQRPACRLSNLFADPAPEITRLVGEVA